MNGPTMVFSNALRKAIDNADDTLYRIAKDSGVNYSTLNRFHRGERSLTLDSAEQLAAYFGLQVIAPARKKRKRKQ